MKRIQTAWCLLALTALACSTAPSAERHFEVGDLGAALSAYEASEVSPEALYFMAMIHLDEEWFDPDRAAALLKRLTTEYPQSSYDRLGRLWLETWRERDRLAADVKRRLAQIEALASEGEALQEQLGEKESALSSNTETVSSLNERIESLEGEIAALTVRLEERERQLEELMSIDLDSEPLDTGEDPSR